MSTRSLKILTTTALLVAIQVIPAARAHTPLFDCFDEEEGKIVCEAGFTDGASAEGIEIRVVNAQGRVLARDEIGTDGSVTFARPDEEFSVVFVGGEGHHITVTGDEIY